jgi:hypothetical protein
MRYSISRTPDSLCIVVPRRFRLLWALFIPLWIAGWITMAVTNPSGKPQSILGLVVFGIVTVFMIYHWLWNFSGEEELIFTISELTHRRVLFNISRTHVFIMDRISDPHFVPARTKGKTYTPSGLGFSYDGQQVRVCDQLTQDEANEIVKAVVGGFPELADRWGTYAVGMFGYEVAE